MIYLKRVGDRLSILVDDKQPQTIETRETVTMDREIHDASLRLTIPVNVWMDVRWPSELR